MAPRRCRPSVLLPVVGAALVAACLGTAPAFAGPQASPSIESVRQQVAALEEQARAAGERQRLASEAVATGTAQLVDVQREAAATEARLTSSKRTMGRLAAESYRTGTIDPAMLQVLFAEDPADTLHQAASVVRVLDRQNAVIDRVTQISTELAADRDKLSEQVAELEENRDVVAGEQQVVEEKTAAAKALLNTLEEEERQRIAAEAAAQAAAAQAEAAQAAAAREAERPSRSATRSGAPAASSPEPAPAASGSCPASGSRGAEAGLTPATLSIMRCGLAAFPQIPSAGGLGSRGNATDHDDGRAVDFMIPNYRSAAGNDLGWRIAEWATKQPNVSYVIFDQMIYGGWSGGWRTMENRGSDTANHRDHVHVSVGG